MLPLTTVSAEMFESHSFLLLGVLVLTFACHGLNCHWLWFSLLLTLLPAHCQKLHTGYMRDATMRSDRWS